MQKISINSLFTSLPMSVSGYAVHTDFTAALKYIADVCPGWFVIFIEDKQIFHRNILEKMSLSACAQCSPEKEERNNCDHFDFQS